MSTSSDVSAPLSRGSGPLEGSMHVPGDGHGDADAKAPLDAKPALLKSSFASAQPSSKPPLRLQPSKSGGLMHAAHAPESSLAVSESAGVLASLPSAAQLRAPDEAALAPDETRKAPVDGQPQRSPRSPRGELQNPVLTKSFHVRRVPHRSNSFGPGVVGLPDAESADDSSVTPNDKEAASKSVAAEVRAPSETDAQGCSPETQARALRLADLQNSVLSTPFHTKRNAGDAPEAVIAAAAQEIESKQKGASNLHRCDSFGPGAVGLEAISGSASAPLGAAARPDNRLAPQLVGPNAKQARLLGLSPASVTRKKHDTRKHTGVVRAEAMAFLRDRGPGFVPNQLTLDAILFDTEQLPVFRSFCEADLMDETLLFVLRVRDFRASPPDQRVSIGLNISHNFLVAGKPLALELPARILERTRQLLLDNDVSAFEEAVRIARRVLTSSVLPLYIAFLSETQSKLPPPNAVGRMPAKAGSILGMSEAALRDAGSRLRQQSWERLQHDHTYQRHLRKSVKLHKRFDLTVTSRDLPIETVLSDAKHYDAFMLFAESHFCAEPILLWRRINEFKAMQDVSASFATHLWKTFLRETAEHAVQLPSQVLQRCRAAVLSNNITPTVFDECQREVVQQICFSIYPQYLDWLNSRQQRRVLYQQDSSESDLDASSSQQHSSSGTSNRDGTTLAVPTDLALDSLSPLKHTSSDPSDNKDDEHEHTRSGDGSARKISSTGATARRFIGPRSVTMGGDIPQHSSFGAGVVGFLSPSPASIEGLHREEDGADQYVDMLSACLTTEDDPADVAGQDLTFEHVMETPRWRMAFRQYCKFTRSDELWSFLDRLAAYNYITPEADLELVGNAIWHDLLEHVALDERTIDDATLSIAEGWKRDTLKDIEHAVLMLLRMTVFPMFVQRVATMKRRNTAAPRRAVPSLRDCLVDETEFDNFVRYAHEHDPDGERALLFWKDVEGFNCADVSVQHYVARHIVHAHLNPHSKPLLSSRIQKQIVFDVEQELTQPELFAIAQREVYQERVLGLYARYVHDSNPAQPVLGPTDVDVSVSTVLSMLRMDRKRYTVDVRLKGRQTPPDWRDHPFWSVAENARLRVLVCSAFVARGVRTFPVDAVAEVKLLHTRRHPGVYRCSLLSQTRTVLLCIKTLTRRDCLAVLQEFTSLYKDDFMVSYSPLRQFRNVEVPDGLFGTATLRVPVDDSEVDASTTQLDEDNDDDVHSAFSMFSPKHGRSMTMY